MALIGTSRDSRRESAQISPAALQTGDGSARPEPATRVRRRARLCANTAIAAPTARGRVRGPPPDTSPPRSGLPCAVTSHRRWKAVVIMPKRRPTLPIAHADDLPTIAFNDEQWQAIEHGYARQLNADVRQQI